MKVLSVQPKLVAQVHQAVVSEIAQGNLLPGVRIIQEQLAEELGVSRQPVQQALALLRNQGVLVDAPGRGLIVAPLDLRHVRDLYEIRAAIEGLAFRRAAELSAEHARRLGPALLEAGLEAVASGSVAQMIAADVRYHSFVHELSRNPLIGTMMEAQWTCAQRVMGDALLRNGTSRDIWGQHEQMLQAVMDGDGERAEALARRHISEAAEVVLGRLVEQRSSEPADGTLNSTSATRSVAAKVHSHSTKPLPRSQVQPGDQE